MTTIRTILDRLKVIEQSVTIAGRVPVVSLFATPEQGQAFELPIISNQPRASTLTTQASGLVWRTRTYDIIVYCAKVGETLTTVAEDAVFDAIEKIPPLFGRHPRLEDLQGVALAGVTSVSLTRDFGLQAPVNLPLQANPQQAYWAVRFELAVQTAGQEGC